jgi:hypothetical protein
MRNSTLQQDPGYRVLPILRMQPPRSVDAHRAYTV